VTLQVNENGCWSPAGSAIVVPKQNPPAPNGNAVTNNCGYSELSSTATGELIWYSGQTTSAITVSNAGDYTLTRVLNGCTSTAVSFHAVPKSTPLPPLVSNTEYCGYAVLATNTTGQLTWNTGETTSAITVTSTGFYAATVTGINACTTATSISIVIHEPPDIFLGNDTTLIAPDSIVLDPGTFASYAWSTNATTQSITVKASGSYFVTVTDQAGCSASDTIVVDVVTGIYNICHGEGYSVYPNPNNGAFWIVFNAGSLGFTDVSVCNLTGEEIYKAAVTAREVHIILPTLAKGIYLIKLTVNGKQHVKKIVVM